MTDQSPEPNDLAFYRLGDADPAAGTSTDVPALRAAVRSRLSGGGLAHGGSAWRWGQIAAAVLAVALVGAGGYLLGVSHGTANAAGDRPSSGAPASSMSASTASSRVGGWVSTAEVGSPPTIAIEPVPAPPYGSAAGASSDAKSVAGFGHLVFHDGGVGEQRSSAQAWAYDASRSVSKETAEHVAAAFGVTGAAVQSYGSWQVGGADGNSAVLTLNGDPTASVYFYNPTVAPQPCYLGDVEAVPDVVSMGSDPGCPDTSPVTAMSADDATRRVSELLTAVGLDPAAFAISVGADQGAGMTSVSANLLLGDGTADTGWWFQFDGDGLYNASGQLAPLVDAGQYSVVSPAEAVVRLNDSRFGSPVGVYAADISIGNTGEASPAATTVTTPPPPSPGAPIPWPVTDVTITSAALGTASYYLSDGIVVLAPTYTLTSADGSAWTVIAVVDEQLDFASR